jgi:SAM-dependent methyltransferase
VGSVHEQLDWYETPRFYDIVFSGDDASEGAFLQAVLREFGRAARRRGKQRVLEPACGSGRLVLEMARRGFAVTGFDGSAAMLAYARKRLAEHRQRAVLVKARLERFDVGRDFDLAHCMVSTFKYLLDEASARSHLRCVARALAPGGLYVIGVHLTQYEDRRRNRERWVGVRGATKVVCNIQGWPADRRTRLERTRSRLSVRERGRERRTETEWLLRTYDWPQFRALVRSVPQFEHVATFDFNYDIERPRAMPDDQLDCVFVLRKRSTAAPSRPVRA